MVTVLVTVAGGMEGVETEEVSVGDVVDGLMVEVEKEVMVSVLMIALAGAVTVCAGASTKITSVYTSWTSSVPKSGGQ